LGFAVVNRARAEKNACRALAVERQHSRVAVADALRKAVNVIGRRAQFIVIAEFMLGEVGQTNTEVG